MEIHLTEALQPHLDMIQMTSLYLGRDPVIILSVLVELEAVEWVERRRKWPRNEKVRLILTFSANLHVDVIKCAKHRVLYAYLITYILSLDYFIFTTIVILLS
jgi:hypothetical protein